MGPRPTHRSQEARGSTRLPRQPSRPVRPLTNSPAPRRSSNRTSAIFAVANRAALFFASAATGAVLARLLEAPALGAWFTAFSFAMIVQSAADLGSSSVVLRELAYGERDARSIVASGLRLSFAGLGTLAVVLYTPLGVWLLEWLNLDTSFRFRSVLIALIATLLGQRMSGDILRGMGDIALATFYVGSVARLMAVTVYCAFLIADREVSVLFTVLVQAVSFGSMCALAAVYILRRLRRMPRSTPAELRFRGTYLILAHTVLWMVLQEGDVVLGGALLTGDRAAEYGIAWRAASLITFPLQALNLIVTPRIAAAVRNGQTARIAPSLARASAACSLTSGCMLIVVLLAGRTILSTWFGSSYSSAYWPLVILGVGQFIGVLIGPGANTLVAAGEDRRLVVGTVAGAVTLLVLGVLLADRFGSSGLAAASATGFVVANASWWRSAVSRVQLRTDGLAVFSASTARR